MSVEALAIVLHHSRAKGTDKLILVGIANHDGDGGAWPGVDKLAKYAHVDERSVRRSLRRLEALGEVRTHVQAGGASGVPFHKRPNRYDVLVECPPNCDRTRHHRIKKAALKAPADLWITGGTPTSPPDAHVPPSPDAHVPPSPDAHVPLTNPSNQPQEEGLSPEVTTDRAPLCSVCSLDELACRRKVATSGHEYTPRGDT